MPQLYFQGNQFFSGSFETLEMIELITKKASPAPNVSIGVLVKAGEKIILFLNDV